MNEKPARVFDRSACEAGRAALPAGGSARASERALCGVLALLFIVSAALTVGWCESMAAAGGMPMPGGWTMSMTWMRMPGQTWSAAAASFLAMWVVMMVATMLPSLAPMLFRYRQAVGAAAEPRIGRLTSIVVAAYLSVWTAVGMAAFPLGVTLAAIEMRLPAVARGAPIAAGIVVSIAGVLQFTAWKAHHLACCRTEPGHGRPLPADTATAWRQGLKFGLHCSNCCAGLTALLLVIGVMDLRAMAVVTMANTLERFAPAGERVARAIGVVVVLAGAFLVAQAAGVQGSTRPPPRNCATTRIGAQGICAIDFNSGTMPD